MRLHRGRDARRGAFTLIEIMVVIAIIAILSGVVGLSLQKNVRQAKVKAARMQIATFQTALEDYRLDHGQVPAEEQGLQALCTRPTVPPVPAEYPEEGYLKSLRVPLDPWDNPYIYIVPGREFEGRKLPYEIISYGSDREPGGAGYDADITSAEL
ncbi:MAG: type II secretion system major pseudopilin GspG [Kiritimatiellae bacterium]|nr:type II secretion system major pseudopilin GspG [Kiritimatiellia bacterium]